MPGSYLTPVRWRDDVGWEYRCGDCADLKRACFWPLTDEFWDRTRSMRRCRACFRDLDARRARAAYLRSTDVRERKRLAARRYHRATRHAQTLRRKDQWLALKADPDRYSRYLEHRRERRKVAA